MNFEKNLHLDPLKGFRPIAWLIGVCPVGLVGAEIASTEAESRLPRLSRLPVKILAFSLIFFIFNDFFFVVFYLFFLLRKTEPLKKLADLQNEFLNEHKYLRLNEFAIN